MINKIKELWAKLIKNKEIDFCGDTKDLILYAADSGGYDTCRNVTLQMIDDKLFLIFRNDNYPEMEVTDQFELTPIIHLKVELND